MNEIRGDFLRLRSVRKRDFYCEEVDFDFKEGKEKRRGEKTEIIRIIRIKINKKT